MRAALPSLLLKFALAPLVWSFALSNVIALILVLLAGGKSTILTEYTLTNTLVLQLLAFALPMLILSSGRKLYRALLSPEAWRDWLQLRWGRMSMGLAFLLMAVGLIAVVGPIINYLSLSIAELLPQSWGIDTSDSVSTQLLEMAQGGWERKLALFGITVLVAPLIEEVYFRGYYHKVIKIWCKGDKQKALWIGACLFSLLHFSAVGFLYRLVLGYALGVLYEHTGRLAPSILLHTLNNLVALVLLLSGYAL